VVDLRIKPEIDRLNSYIDVYGSFHCPKAMVSVLEQIRQGFNMYLHPKLTEDGTSGAYLLRNADKDYVAIFKPIDEEPYAPNNPRGHQAPFGSPSFRPGILSGEVCVREVAAYLLDHQHFSKVPPTTFVEVIHQSLKYVPFTGMEVSTDTYMDIMKSLIRPVNLDETLFVTLNKTSESKDLSTSVSRKVKKG